MARGEGPYDVIIAGGGAAGCVLAARLSESGARSVLLLEAGPDLRAHVPDHLRDAWTLSPDYDWGYSSETDARGVAEPLRRGKLLGGTSWVTRFGLRDSPADWDEWTALGNVGWSFDDVLPYYNRLESDAEFGDLPWHGASGPIPLTRYPELEQTEIAAAALDVLVASDFRHIDDLNEPGALGAGRMPMSSRDGIRVTTAAAYLPFGATPPNLTIRADAHVAEILLEGETAIGVRLLDGTVIEAGWVILSAGSYGSPAILMRSGVGPPEHLRSLDIPVRIDLPGVGANLVDHMGVDIDCGYRRATRTSPILHAVATFHSSAAPIDGPPDLMLWLSDPRGDPAIFEIDVVLLKPRSRGSVRLRSADPADPPLIKLPGLSDPSDAKRLAEGLERGLNVAQHPDIRRLCDSPPLPDPGDDPSGVVRAEAYSIPHAVGTCSMGPRPENGSVVDTSGQVHGTQRLSVVDASIIPNAPSGFTHLTTVMLAERLSEESYT